MVMEARFWLVPWAPKQRFSGGWIWQAEKRPEFTTPADLRFKVLEIEAREKLRRAKRFPRESFSEVVLRASIPDGGIRDRELLASFAAGDAITCLSGKDLKYTGYL
jgi:hypothetical protein